MLMIQIRIWVRVSFLRSKSKVTIKDCQLYISFQLSSEMLKNGLNNLIQNLIAIVFIVSFNVML